MLSTSLKLLKGDDYLSTLDIFLKKHKLNFTDLYDISVECIDGEVMACRLAKVFSSASRVWVRTKSTLEALK